MSLLVSEICRYAGCVTLSRITTRSAHMVFTPKSSSATKWWLGILLLVLVALFLETRTRHNAGSNFLVNTNNEAMGAEVIVDGQRLGTVGTAQNSGIGGGAFWGHLTRGRHVVELRKPGYLPFSKDVDMRGEAFLGVDLKPQNN